MLRVTFLLLLFMGWNNSGDAGGGRKQEAFEICETNVTSKAGMTARMYCCLGVTNKGAEVRNCLSVNIKCHPTQIMSRTMKKMSFKMCFICDHILLGYKGLKMAYS